MEHRHLNSLFHISLAVAVHLSATTNFLDSCGSHKTALSPFHISPAAAVHLSTNTLLGYFLRQPQDHLTFRKAARLSQRRTENFQQVHFPCVFRPMFGGRKAAARQPRDDRTVDVRIRTN